MQTVPVELVQIVFNETTPEQIITLEEVSGKRRLPIIIGSFEARAIEYYINNCRPPRPWPHELLATTIEALGARVDRVVVSELREGTFYALIVLAADNQDIEIDSRPSDAIALACLLKAPIFVAESVFRQAQG